VVSRPQKFAETINYQYSTEGEHIGLIRDIKEDLKGFGRKIMIFFLITYAVARRYL